MNQHIKFLFVVLFACSVLSNRLPHARAHEPLDYETIKFFTSSSSPLSLASQAFSPDGRYLALVFDTHYADKVGIHLVDLEKMKVEKRIGKHEYFGMSFTSDSRRILAVGAYSIGFDEVDVVRASVRDANVGQTPIGKIGLSLETRNGKLVISKTAPDSNPTMPAELKVGNELLAMNEGQKATKYDDSDEWKTLTGKSVDDALAALAGRPGTWLQLRLLQRGRSTPHEISLQRQWPSGVQRDTPRAGINLVQTVQEGAFHYRAADTYNLVGCMNFCNIRSNGLKAISPDGRYIASIGTAPGEDEFYVEIHSIEKGTLEQAVLFESENYNDIEYSADGKLVLIGSRDSIRILDVESSTWQSPIVLSGATINKPVDEAGRSELPRFGLPDDLYTSYRELTHSSPMNETEFAVSPNGVVAIGSDRGDLALAALKSRERLGIIGEEILGGSPQLLDFSPNGGHLVAYARGVLHMIRFDDSDRSHAGEDLPR